jgi:UDP-N-acetylmuramoylalanine--D-glutamate ligase
MELRGKRVLVIGLARTGVATAGFCAQRGAVVTITDTRSEAELAEAAAKLKACGVLRALGGHSDLLLSGQDLVVPSPGVPEDAPLLAAARAKVITVWSIGWSS